MHCCFGEDACYFAIEERFQLGGLFNLLGSGEEEGRGEVLAGYFFGELGEGAAAKDDSGGSRVVFKSVHCDY